MIQVVVHSEEDGAKILSQIEKHVDRIILVKVGDKDRPATEEDIKDISQCMDKALKSENPRGDISALVTHHAVEIVDVYIRE